MSCVILKSHAANKNGINEKGHLLLAFILLTLTAWILRGSSKIDMTGTHVAYWLSIPPQVALASCKPECGRHIDASEF